METKTVVDLNAEIAAVDSEIVQAETELRELEAAADTSAKGLDAHGRLVSRVTMLRSRRVSLESEILPAKRAEAAAKLEMLKAEHNAALKHREEVVKECREKIGDWFDYPGGEMFARQALNGALPVKGATSKVIDLEGQLRGALSHLQSLPK